MVLSRKAQIIIYLIGFLIGLLMLYHLRSNSEILKLTKITSHNGLNLYESNTVEEYNSVLISNSLKKINISFPFAYHGKTVDLELPINFSGIVGLPISEELNMVSRFCGPYLRNQICHLGNLQFQPNSIYSKVTNDWFCDDGHVIISYINDSNDVISVENQVQPSSLMNKPFNLTCGSFNYQVPISEYILSINVTQKCLSITSSSSDVIINSVNCVGSSLPVDWNNSLRRLKLTCQQSFQTIGSSIIVVDISYTNKMIIGDSVIAGYYLNDIKELKVNTQIFNNELPSGYQIINEERSWLLDIGASMGLIGVLSPLIKISEILCKPKDQEVESDWIALEEQR
jgi:hypothetical protein